MSLLNNTNYSQKDFLTDDLNRSFYEKEDEFDEFNNEKNRGQEEILEEGILDEETIVKNLNNMGRIADGTKVAYLSLSLPGFSLQNIKALSKFKELQSLELSYNKLKDLSVLSELPFLLTLSVSHNLIEKLFDFLPPYNLKEASFSFNQINEIGNLSNFHYLQSLELNNNKISRIEGLDYCQRLKNLNLAHNAIKKIEGLDNLPLVNLDLRSNQIKNIEGLDTLKFLRNLNLSGNQIKSLKGIPERHEFIETLDFENNKINDLNEIENLVGLNLLRDLNFHHNSIRELEDYRLSVIFKIPKLTMLDRRKVDPSDKVNATNIFNPSPEYIASRDHMTNFIFNIIQDHKVRESTLPSVDSPYPILILCGPEGSGTNEISRRLAEEYPGYFDYVVTHTTRKPRENEKDKINFNFIKMQDFEQDVTQGKFICCNEYLGDWYGIQWDSIEEVARQGLACVTHMELESLISFKQTYFEPRCVLIVTLDKSIQMQRLVSKGNNENECEIAANRTEWYAEYNRDHPGFFDAVIVTDDLNEGYENLKNLVLNYLGVANEEQQTQIQQNQQNLSNQIQRQLSNLQSSRPKTSEEIRSTEETYTKDFDPHRSGNRSQMSRMSMESLSQIYNQNLRLKYGSAPAQLLSKGEQAEKSLEKRMSALKTQFETTNMVNTKSQLTQHMSKQAMIGTASTNSWVKWEDKSKPIFRNSNSKNDDPASRHTKLTKINYNEISEDSSDDDLIQRNRNNKNKNLNKNETNEQAKINKKLYKNQNGPALLLESGRSSNYSNNSIDKFF